MMGVTWQEKVQKTRTELTGKIPKAWRIAPDVDNDDQCSPFTALSRTTSSGALTAREIAITSTQDATELLGKIHSKVLSAEEVAIAFCKRAAVAKQLLNCLMDVDFDNAIARAKQLDTHLQSTGKVVGPLHGLPVSIKDLTSVKGLHYTMGYVSWAEKISGDDAVVVETLRKAGAVIYVKTTMPQSGMCLETTSNLYGRTLNPFNVKLTPGGSSGGESALISSRGSILGMGTDSGGSIRIPAAFTGLYSLKPTASRVSYQGNNNNSSGIGGRSSIGPMGHSIRDIQLATKVLINGKHWLKDPDVVEKPWLDHPKFDVQERRLRVGLAEWDEHVMPHPPIFRALHTARQKLLAAGHEVVSVVLYRHFEGAELSSRLFTQLGTTFMSEELNATGEPAIPAIRGKPGKQSSSLADVIETKKAIHRYKSEYLSWWNSTKTYTADKEPIDVLLLPCGGSTSFPHDYVPKWDYVRIYNLIDYPAVTIPVTTVDEEIDTQDLHYLPANEDDKANHELYDPQLFHGMPVSLQLVSRPFSEELLLEAASEIDRVLKAG